MLHYVIRKRIFFERSYQNLHLNKVGIFEAFSRIGVLRMSSEEGGNLILKNLKDESAFLVIMSDHQIKPYEADFHEDWSDDGF